MKIIPQISKYLQEILISESDKLSKETNFVKRKSKMTGELFAQTLVFGWLSKPTSTLEELSQVAMSLGLKISAQGIEKRFNKEASEFLKGLLEKIVTKLVCSDKVSLKILNKFSGVHILDTSIISLPEQLKELWIGCGGTNGTNSALKMGVRLDLLTGELNGPFLEHGKGSDKGSLINKDIPKPGGLRIGDLGFFIEQFKINGCNNKEHEFGYRSIHYLIKSNLSKETRISEIQVRTIFEEAWSEIDHTIRYPDYTQNPIVNEFLVNFNRLAGSADEMGSFINNLKSFLQVSLEKQYQDENTIKELQKKIESLDVTKEVKQELESSVNKITLRLDSNLASYLNESNLKPTKIRKLLTDMP